MQTARRRPTRRPRIAKCRDASATWFPHHIPQNTFHDGQILDEGWVPYQPSSRTMRFDLWRKEKHRAYALCAVLERRNPPAAA
jgi:hypothetical protein